jgi:tricorn protease-like protein
MKSIRETNIYRIQNTTEFHLHYDTITILIKSDNDLYVIEVHTNPKTNPIRMVATPNTR